MSLLAKPVKSPCVSLPLSSLVPSCSPDLVLPLTPAPVLGPSPRNLKAKYSRLHTCRIDKDHKNHIQL